MIKNLTNKKVIATNSKIAKSSLKKAIGLMFSKKIKDKGLIFVFDHESIIPLHMFFVFYPIDVLFLNNNKEVVEIKENFKPFTFYTNENPAMYIIELPAGAIKESKTKLKDKISF